MSIDTEINNLFEMLSNNKKSSFDKAVEINIFIATHYIKNRVLEGVSEKDAIEEFIL